MAAIPDMIGRYRVRDVIGTGGFATVYRALDERFGVEVAVKVLAENRSFEPDVRERFLDEGRRLRRLRSTHLITVHDLAETDRGQPYLVMELADRGDLATRVRQLRQVGWQPGTDDLRDVVGSVGTALDTLHRHNLVHRDVAPRNLLLRLTMTPRAIPMLTSDEALDAAELTAIGVSARARPAPPLDPRVRRLVADGEQLMLSDLGVSKDLAAASGLTLAAGTSGFAPPEQREPGHRIDQRADIWGASALVVWLILNRAPEETEEWQEQLLRRGWPARFEQALARGLAERADERHPTVGDWQDALETALVRPSPSPASQAVVHVPAEGPGPGPDTGTGRRPWRRTALTAVGVVAALLVGVGLGSRITDDSPPEPTVEREQLDRDTVSTTAEGAGVTVTVYGPPEAVVDVGVTLSADIDGTDSWTWLGPEGPVAWGETSITANPQTVGEGVISLIAFDDRGQLVEAEHVFTVVEPG